MVELREVEWTVTFAYEFEDVRYVGHHISPSKKSVMVGHGVCPIDLLMRMKEIEFIWRDPRNPARSAVFRSEDLQK